VDQPVDIARVALEIAAAFLVIRRLVADRLAAEDPRPDQVAVVAGQAWRHHAPTWLRLAVPAVRQAMQLGLVQGLTPEELELLATEYVESLGSYLSDTSGEALLAGYAQQLDARWDARLAWHRATAAYGLDRQQMRAYVGSLLAGDTPRPDLVPTAARLLVDKALTTRADGIGESEAWRAMQSGQALAWMLLQQRGEIPADALREWRRTSEEACPTCLALHGQRVPLTEPFVLGSSRYWAPGAHPNCRCRQRLVLRMALEEVAPVAKRRAGDPYDRDRRGRFAPVDERPTRPAEPPAPEVQAVLDQLHGVAPAKPDLFGRPDLFGKPDLFAAKPDLFGKPAGSLFAGRRPQLFDRTRRPPPGPPPGLARKRVIHHILVPARVEGEERPRSHEPYYLPASEFLQAYEQAEYELWEPGDVFDFDDANAAIRELHAYYHEGDDVAYGPQTLTAMQTYDPLDLDFDSREQWHAEDRVVDEQWAELRPHVVAAHRQALANVDEVVDRLGSQDIAGILRLAGYDPGEEANSARARIVRAVNAGVGSDQGLAGAYADWVAWQEPEILGDSGMVVGSLLNEAVDNDIRLITPEEAQYFAFDNGFHEETQFTATGHLVALRSGYVVSHATYHSALLEHGADAEPFMVGWRELSMVPVDDAGARLPRD
jgi:hypothetical protein